MKFYEFGDEHNPVILLLPGTCCHWKANFEKVIPFLAQDFRVVCVSYDGFDETEKSVFHGNVFPDMVTETEKIENYIKENCGGKIHAAYGCSLGGSFVGLLAQRRKILYGMFQKGRLPGFMKRWLEKKPADERLYYEKMLDMFGMNNTRISAAMICSMRNC